MRRLANGNLCSHLVNRALVPIQKKNLSDYILPPTITEAQARKIEHVDSILRNRHAKIEANIVSDEERDLVRRRRMIYRSKQRGWLEVDILLGTFAVDYVPSLTQEELDEYELILAEETIDIYNYVSGKDPLPPHLENLGIMKKLKEHAFGICAMTPEDYAKLKDKANLI